ncbi:MAG: glutaredoxin [Anaerolineaceae bacterium]|nr:MAG: glutaredoxin [Anaerolineaceae bacterium]
MTDIDKQLVMYSRTTGCPFLTLARRVLHDYHVAYHEIFIDRDAIALHNVVTWTGFRSVPTLVIARRGEIVPYVDVAPLPTGHSPRGIDRGAMITEPNIPELEAWLTKHGLIEMTS